MKKNKKTSKPAKSGSKKPASKKPVTKPAVKTAKVAPKSESEIGVRPLGDRVIVRPMGLDEVETMTSFGMIIPDSAKEKPEQGTVVAVGPGKHGDDNELVPMQVAVGDTVLFSKYGFDKVKVAGEEYYILSESSILAVIG